MRNTLGPSGLTKLTLWLLPWVILAQEQRPQTSTPQPAAASLSNAPAVTRDFIRERYTKFEYRVAMRDGIKLFTSVHIPKDAFTEGRKYPILLQRTGYNVAPYGGPRISPPQLHLPHMVLRGNVSLGEEQIVGTFGVDMRDAPFIAQNLDGTLKTGDRQFSVVLGEPCGSLYRQGYPGAS
jgi:hypothetical protein